MIGWKRMSTGTKTRFFRGLLLVVVVVALIAGTTLHAARQADGRLRADLLQQARMVAMTIDPQQVASLTGTEADLAAPGYIRLHERLILVRLSNPICRFLYLMSRAPDGTVFFTVDSEPADSEDYTPPGETYDEAPAELHVVFATGQAAVRGPYVDRWGVWISAFVPMPDPEAAGMEAVLGLDIDAREWKRTIALEAAVPAVLTAGVILLGLLAGGLYQSGRQLRARQAELQESEEKARQGHVLSKAIINSVPGAFYMVGADGRYVGWNAYQRDEIVGKPESEMTDTYAIDTIHPDDRALVGARIANVLENGTEEVVEGRVLLRGGPDYRWLLMTGRQMMIEGSPVLIGIGMDITDRKKANERVEVSAAEARRLLRDAEASRRTLLSVVEDQQIAEAAIQKQLGELRRWQSVTLDREDRVIALKREVNELAVKLGEKPRYESAGEG